MTEMTAAFIFLCAYLLMMLFITSVFITIYWFVALCFYIAQGAVLLFASIIGNTTE